MSQSELHLSEFFENTPDFVCIASRDGYFKKVNPAVIQKLGYREDELFSRPIHSFIYPDDKQVTALLRERLINGEPLLNFQNRYVTKDGNIIWLEWSSIYHNDKGVVFAIAKDITLRKQREKEIEEKYLKYKNLAANFKKNMEDDRKLLASEMHEEIAQLATVIKFDLEWLRSDVGNMSEIHKQKLEHTYAVAEVLISTVQRLSFTIDPQVLDDLGLNAAIEFYCSDFALLSGIPCFFESNCQHDNLSAEVKLDLFRICQEALAGILDQNSRGRVFIRIDDSPGNICLSIRHEGGGFDEEIISKKLAFARIKTRVASINGNLETSQPVPGGETSIVVRVPF